MPFLIPCLIDVSRQFPLLTSAGLVPRPSLKVQNQPEHSNDEDSDRSIAMPTMAPGCRLPLEWPVEAALTTIFWVEASLSRLSRMAACNLHLVSIVSFYLSAPAFKSNSRHTL